MGGTGAGWPGRRRLRVTASGQVVCLPAGGELFRERISVLVEFAIQGNQSAVACRTIGRQKLPAVLVGTIWPGKGCPWPGVRDEDGFGRLVQGESRRPARDIRLSYC